MAAENVALWHERDISHSSAERVIFPDACIVLDYMLDLVTDVIEDLVVYPERMRANLDLTGGLIFSQRVLLALVDAGMDRQVAYKVVQRHALAAWDGGTPFSEALAQRSTSYRTSRCGRTTCTLRSVRSTRSHRRSFPATGLCSSPVGARRREGARSRRFVSHSPPPLSTLPVFRRGKVRETYDLGDNLLMVASDRLSAFDVVLPSTIPGKGSPPYPALTLLAQQDHAHRSQSLRLHRHQSSIVGHDPTVRHRNRAMIVRKADRIDIECVVRGYLAGSGWREYRRTTNTWPIGRYLPGCSSAIVFLNPFLPLH